MNQTTHRWKAKWLSLGVLGSAGVAGLGYGLGLTQGVTADTRPPAVTEQHREDVQQANVLSNAFRGAADRVLPAVVSIQHRIEPKLTQREARTQRGRQQVPPGFEDLPPEIRRFFGDQFDRDDLFGESQPQRSRPRESSGSGVIIDPAGVVLTNNHVVAGGGKITVTLGDGREFEAEEVLTDPGTDIAVVRIKADKPLPFAQLGNSDEMRIGDWVLALGQPFGLQDTVTAGIISAKGRALGMMRHEEFLQTDAAINPGNSGGPLVNLHGEVIGINTAISSSSGGFQGIGFAVPVNVAKWVSEQLQQNGKVQRAYLGVGIQPVDTELAEQFDLNTPSGALVTDVQPDSPAAKAGLKAQDVIVEFDGQKIRNHRQLSAVVGRSPIDGKQPIVVIRDGKRVKLNVTLREAPANFGVTTDDSDEPSESSESESPSAQFNKLGLQVAPLTKDVAQQLGLNVNSGVVVTGVEEGSVAAKAGVSESMVITQVGRKTVRNVEEFEAEVKDASLERGVLLLVKSNEGSRFVVLKSE